MTDVFLSRALRCCAGPALALLVALATPVAAQTTAPAAKGEPGSGFADPDAPPRRPPPADIEPVIGALLTIGSVVWSVADKRGRTTIPR